MIKKSPRKLAEDFISGQLKIMAKHGSKTKASQKLIAESVGRAEKSFRSLTCDDPEKLDLR